MKTPSGQNAQHMDPVFLLSMWADHQKQQGQEVICAGMGRPTYALNETMVQSFVSYWAQVQASTRPVIGYGYPQGDLVAREHMATAMSSWYQTEVLPQNVLFTVGGAGALRVIFDTFDEVYQNKAGYRIITPLPYYTLYADHAHHRLHPIEVMKSPGYQLTAEVLKQSIEAAYQEAKTDGAYPQVVLLCNPNNPLGTVIAREELQKIATVLKAYPALYIMLDEAYTEMSFVMEEAPSLLTLAPELKSRMVILRSATKALAAAGERLAMLMAFDEQLMMQFMAKNIHLIGHAPRSAQRAYADTMLTLTPQNLEPLVLYYFNKSRYVQQRLQEMGAKMPDPLYQPQGTFYVMADLSDFLGHPLSPQVQDIIGPHERIETDEDLVYTLLIHHGLMFAPLSYFGANKREGYVRITCSGSEEELCQMMDRLQHGLYAIRDQNHRQRLQKTDEIMQKKAGESLGTLETSGDSVNVSPPSQAPMCLKVQENIRAEEAHLKTMTTKVSMVRSHSWAFFTQAMGNPESPKRRSPAISPGRIAKDQESWRTFVEKLVKPSEIQHLLLNLDPKDRAHFTLWRSPTPQARHAQLQSTSPSLLCTTI